jgi:signal transduction histidine kinase
MKLFKQSSYPLDFKYTKFFKLRFLTFLLVMQVFIVPVVQANVNGSIDFPTFKAWLISGLLVLPITLAMLYGTRKFFVDAFGNKIPVRLVLIAGFAIGFIKGFATHYFANLLHIRDTFPIDEMVVRGLSGGTLAMALSFSLCLKATLSNDFREIELKERQIDEIAMEIGVLKGEISVLKSGSSDLIISRVLGSITKKLDFDLLNSNPERNWKQISSALRDDLASHVRNESYSLTEFKHTNTKSRHHWLHVFVTQQIHLAPITFGVINLAAGLATFYLDHDNWSSFGLPIINFLVSVVIIATLKKVQEKTSYGSALFNHFPVFTSVALSVFFLLSLNYLLQGRYQMAPLYVVVLWQLFLLYSISTAYALIEFKTKRIAHIASIYQDLEQKLQILKDYDQRLRNDISTHLHGFLVSKVRKGSTQLDNLAKEQDFVKYTQTLKALLSEFTLDKFIEGFKRDLIGPDFFKACKESWEGIVCIEFLGELEFPAYVHETTLVELAQVVEEIIANANRHGDATDVSIDFSWLDKERLEITARDNGIGIKSGYKKGLGCALYDQASDGNWSIKGAEGVGSTLHMMITLWEHEAHVKTIAMEPAASDLLERHSRPSY